MMRFPARLAVVMAVALGVGARGHAQPTAPPAPSEGPATPGNRPAAPQATSPNPMDVTPKRIAAIVTVRDDAGTELRRIDVDTGGAAAVGARGECAYMPSGPAANMLALAIGAKGQAVVQTQIADAKGKGKPSLRNVTVTLMESKPNEATTLEFDEGACRLESSKFDGKNGDFNIRCDGAGRQLRAPRKMELKLHVEGCPTATPPQPNPGK